MRTQHTQADTDTRHAPVPACLQPDCHVCSHVCADMRTSCKRPSAISCCAQFNPWGTVLLVSGAVCDGAYTSRVCNGNGRKQSGSWSLLPMQQYAEDVTWGALRSKGPGAFTDAYLPPPHPPPLCSNWLHQTHPCKPPKVRAPV